MNGVLVPVGGAGGPAVGAWAMRAWGIEWTRIANRGRRAPLPRDRSLDPTLGGTVAFTRLRRALNHSPETAKGGRSHAIAAAQF